MHYLRIKISHQIKNIYHPSAPYQPYVYMVEVDGGYQPCELSRRFVKTK